MNQLNKEQLKNRYGASQNSNTKRKELSLNSNRSNRETALGSSSKPLNTKATISRLFNYLSK